MGITTSLTGSIKITDNITGSTSLSKPLNNSYSGTVQTYGQNVVVGTSPSTVTLPISPVEFIYIKNLSTTSGTTVTVTWTPTGGSSASIVTLDPGAVVIVSEVTTSNGITALSIVANAAGTPCEYVLCG